MTTCVTEYTTASTGEGEVELQIAISSIQRICVQRLEGALELWMIAVVLW
jgi:hypothetical protein